MKQYKLTIIEYKLKLCNTNGQLQNVKFNEQLQNAIEIKQYK